MCSVDDADPWDFVTSTHPVARKPHGCGECRRVIRRGERYYRCEGRSSYRGGGSAGFDCHKVCAHCQVLGDWLTTVCGGYLFGNIVDEVREHVIDNAGHPDDVAAFGAVARALGQARMRWTRFDGSLFEVPDRLPVPPGIDPRIADRVWRERMQARRQVA